MKGLSKNKIPHEIVIQEVKVLNLIPPPPSTGKPYSYFFQITLRRLVVGKAMNQSKSDIIMFILISSNNTQAY